MARALASTAYGASVVSLSGKYAPTNKAKHMRHVIVAGGREFLNYALLTYILRGLLHPADVIVSGCAPGADSLAIKFADEYGWKCEKFPADWANEGKYKAGFLRNTRMVACSQVLIAFWDGQSGGTRDVIFKALEAKREVHVYNVWY